MGCCQKAAGPSRRGEAGIFFGGTAKLQDSAELLQHDGNINMGEADFDAASPSIRSHAFPAAVPAGPSPAHHPLENRKAAAAPPSGSPSTAKVALALLEEFVAGAQPALLMDSFVMFMDADSVMGEGSFSICRKGVDIKTGEVVAVKTFKIETGDTDETWSQDVQLKKFRKQVDILESLAKPLELSEEEVLRLEGRHLWFDQLKVTRSDELFVKLIDYSKDYSIDERGEPGRDAGDDVFYLVMELASYSLDDYLYDQCDADRKLSRRAVQELSRAILIVTAGLHAKGLCHLDLKPENLMLFSSRMKLIDVDGCREIDSTVKLGDHSVSFSPAFCAPEWARWMTDTDENADEWVSVSPALDSWSVGMTICQLITLEVVFEKKYAEFPSVKARSNFLTWLSMLTEPPVPDSVRPFDPDLAVLCEALLTCDASKRRTVASCLSFGFVQESLLNGADNKVMLDEEEMACEDHTVKRPSKSSAINPAMARMITAKPLLQSVLWQLKVQGNAEKLHHWIRYDMWITSEFYVCHYCLLERQCIVCVDPVELEGAEIVEMDQCMRGFGLVIRPQLPRHATYLAFDDDRTRQLWALRLGNVRSVLSRPPAPPPVVGGDSVVGPCLQLECRNRRAQVPPSARRDYEPVFRTVLWKARQGGDLRRREDWHCREMWISINLHLVYYSVKEDRDLIYHNGHDLERAQIERIESGEVALPWAFKILVPAEDGVCCASGVFAAISEKARERWIEEFHVQRAWQQKARKSMMHVRTSSLRVASREGGESIFLVEDRLKQDLRPSMSSRGGQLQDVHLAQRGGSGAMRDGTIERPRSTSRMPKMKAKAKSRPSAEVNVEVKAKVAQGKKNAAVAKKVDEHKRPPPPLGKTSIGKKPTTTIPQV